MALTREGWLDTTGDTTGNQRVKKISLKRPDGSSTTIVTGDGLEFFNEDGRKMGGTTIRIRGRQATREPVNSLGPTYQAINRMVKDGTLRSSQRSAAELKAGSSAWRLNEIKEQMEQVFWVVWPYMTGLVALAFVAGGLARINPLSVIVGLSLGILAWKGEQVAKWFDVKEKAVKERQRMAVEAEVQRQVAEKVEKAPEAQPTVQP